MLLMRTPTVPTDRDIRELRGAIDPRLGKILIGMNGDIHALRQAIGTLAGICQELAAALNVHNAKLAQVVASKANPHAENLRKMSMEVSSDPSVTGEIDEK